MVTKVLIIDDDHDLCAMIAAGLTQEGFSPSVVYGADDAIEAMQREDFAAVALDLELGDRNGLELCRRFVDSHAGVPVVIMTGRRELETAIEAMRAGAYDFVAKPFRIEQLAFSLRRGVGHQALAEQVRRLRELVDGASRPGDIIGDSRAMRRLYEQIDQAAASDATVLITGESGTGKELIARAIHERSPRSAGPFVALNCAAVVPSLLESELFGHTKGAFTGAQGARPGLFVHATNGTLFLDEIGEMPLEMQAKLLRVLQEGRVRPVGGEAEVAFDTRILAATNRDIEAEVEHDKFRTDLYYRLNVLRIDVPPLRSRGADVLEIAQHLLTRQALRSRKPMRGISVAAAERLVAYDWPGNVRELQNCIERAVAVARFDEITPDDLPLRIRDHQSSNLVIASDNPDEMPTLAEMERRYVRRVLEAVKGNKTHAARVLGLDRRTLYRKIERMNPSDLEAELPQD